MVPNRENHQYFMHGICESGCRKMEDCSPQIVPVQGNGIGRLLLAGRILQLCRHSDQFRQGFRLHLVHHVAAMDFHSDLAGPQIEGDLLIEHPRNHHEP